MNHIPVAVGLLLCEQVIVDEKTKNLTPVNCFSSRKLESLPGKASFHVVAWLSDGLGEMDLKIVVEKLGTSDEIVRVEKQVRFDDRLKDMRFTARLRDCNFPEPGYYEVTLTIGGEFVAHRKLLIYV